MANGTAQETQDGQERLDLEGMTDRQLLIMIAYNIQHAANTIDGMAEMVKTHGIMALLKGGNGG